MRKREQLLSEAKYRTLLENAHDGIIVLRNGAFVDANNRALEMFGYSYADFIGIDPAMVSPERQPDGSLSREKVTKLLNATLSGTPQRFQWVHTRSNGTPFAAEISLSRFLSENGDLVMAALRDVTQERQAEEALRSSEKKFSDAFRMVQSILYISELSTGRLLEVNEAFIRTFGYTQQEVLGRSTLDLGLWQRNEDRAMIVEEVRKAGHADSYPVRMVRKDGVEISFIVSATLLKHDATDCLLMSMVNVTGRIERERKLRESEEKFATAFMMSPDQIAISDFETGEIYEVNEGFLKTYEHSAKTVRGKTVFELNVWENPDDRKRLVKRVLEDGECLNFPAKIRTGTGKMIDVIISARAITLGGKKCMLTVSHDITELKRLQDQLQHSQKLEAVGKLAGGVAHDFNNILTGIIGHAELALRKIGRDSPAAVNLDTVLSLSGKAGQLNHSLLAFSRKQVLNKEPVSVAKIVQKTESFLRRLIGEDIEFSAKVRGDAVVNADSLQIEHVIMNMVVNARDAMPRGGKLTIAVDVVEIDETVMYRHRLDKSGDYACITISDTGTGMTEEVQEHIFEPFYTTKEIGKGTGLGLAMAYGNIKQHGGFIAVYSEVGIGTEFKIYLPAVFGVVRAEKRSRHVSPAGGSEMILMVEDDEVVRDINTMVLEIAGYTVIAAKDGEEALRLYADNSGRIDMIVLDVILPKLNGREVFEEIKHSTPSIKVLFLSGYTDDYIRERTELGADVNIALKPISPDKLLLKVREMLDRS